MQHAQRVAKNTGILYVQMAITVVLSLYTTRLVLAALGAEDFGIFNVVGGAIAMLTFLNTAMASASQRFMSYAQGQGDFEKQKTIFNVSLVLHFFIGLAVVALLEVVGFYLFEDVLKIAADRMDVAKLIYQFLIVSTFFTIVSVPFDAVINAHENMFLVAIVRIIEVVLKLAIAIYITEATSDKLYMYGFLMASLTVVLMIFKQLYCHRAYDEVRINIKKHFSRPIFKEMTSFAGWSFLGSAASIVSNYGQGIVLNIFFGTTINASQGVANQISGQLSAFAGVMLKALNPVIAKSEGAGNRSLMLKASIFGSKTSFFLLLLFFIPAMIEMPYILSKWLEKVPEFAVIFCVLLLIKNLIEQLFFTLTSSISAVGNIKEFRIYTSALSFFPLVVSYMLFRFNYPPYTLYIVFIIYSLLNSIMILYFAKKHCNLSIKLFLSDVVVKCILTFGIVFSLSLLPHLFMAEGFVRLISVGLLSFILLITTIWFVGLTDNEKLLMKNMFESLRKKLI